MPEGIDLTSFASLIGSIAERYPVISCWTAGRSGPRCHTGRVARVGRKQLLFRELDAEAEWLPTRNIPLRRVSQVDFDGDYERVLHLVNQAYSETRLAFSPGVGTA